MVVTGSPNAGQLQGTTVEQLLQLLQLPGNCYNCYSCRTAATAPPQGRQGPYEVGMLGHVTEGSSRRMSSVMERIACMTARPPQPSGVSAEVVATYSALTVSLAVSPWPRSRLRHHARIENSIRRIAKPRSQRPVCVRLSAQAIRRSQIIRLTERDPRATSFCCLEAQLPGKRINKIQLPLRAPRLSY